ncbi:hypothetical protein OG242_32315 (plasmid) [Streptomyces sp. NBC_00727]|uniref:hypothetical protein n=1 Tax=Streptomyces sp. NBC_00727 TaxID=2903675 RepID=UPI002F9140C9
MGLDITTLIADWPWLAEVPPRERLSRLRNAWYGDETGLWDDEAPGTDGGWEWPRGPHRARFGVYEFPGTAGSFKPHFWVGEGWERTREHVGPTVRAELDALLGGLTWDGPDFDDEESEDRAFFSHDSVLVACSPERVRELLATWERVRPRLDELRAPFDEHAALPEGWIPDFDAFVRLLTGWGEVLAQAARRGWGIAGVSG